MELNEQENQKYIYVFMDKHKSEYIYLYVIWTKPEFSSWNENIKTSKFLTQAGNTGLQTVQSSNFNLGLSHIHCKWTKLAKFKNMSESWPYLFVKLN